MVRGRRADHSSPTSDTLPARPARTDPVGRIGDLRAAQEDEASMTGDGWSARRPDAGPGQAQFRTRRNYGAAEPEADGLAAGSGGRTTLSSDSAIFVGSLTLWLVRTAIVTPSSGR